MRKTINTLLAEYGAAAVVVYFTIFFGVFLGAWAGLRYGWDPRPLVVRMGLNPDGIVANAGPWLVAYGVAKVTQPARIAATLVLTPIVAKLWERLSGRRRAAAAVGADSPDASGAARRAE